MVLLSLPIHKNDFFAFSLVVSILDSYLILGALLLFISRNKRRSKYPSSSGSCPAERQIWQSRWGGQVFFGLIPIECQDAPGA